MGGKLAGHGSDGATRVTYSGIVDERATPRPQTRAHPLTCGLPRLHPRMAAVLTALNSAEGALLLPSGNYNQWDLVR